MTAATVGLDTILHVSFVITKNILFSSQLLISILSSNALPLKNDDSYEFYGNENVTFFHINITLTNHLTENRVNCPPPSFIIKKD